MNPTPKQITETLDSAGFVVTYCGMTKTWSIIDTVDEDGFRDFGIRPEFKELSMVKAYEFIIENIFRKKS